MTHVVAAACLGTAPNELGLIFHVIKAYPERRFKKFSAN